MEVKGKPETDIQKELDRYHRLNFAFSDGRVLNSMYTTPHPLAVKAHMQFIESNLGNPGLCPGTVEMEKEVILMLKTLVSAGDGVKGHITDGGTESNITAMWMARNNTGKKVAVFPESGHFSLQKAAGLLGMESRTIPLDEKHTADLGHLEKAMDDDVAIVIGVAGTTELGMVDPIEEMAEIVGNRAFLHVDAAFGGFVLPFMREMGIRVPKYDFSVDGVTSVTMDPHKMGLSTLPCGALLYRMQKEETICTDAPYLTKTKQFGLLGTRASGAVAGAYAVMKHLGREGYKKQVSQCLDSTAYLVKRMEEIGVRPVTKPFMNIAVFPLDNLQEIRAEMERFGWALSVSRTPPGLRIVVMPHVTKEVIDSFVSDLKNVLAVHGGAEIH